MKSILVANLFWVTWSPSVSRKRVSFCFTGKSYTLLYNNNILWLKFNNLNCICKLNGNTQNFILKKWHHWQIILKMLTQSILSTHLQLLCTNNANHTHWYKWNIFHSNNLLSKFKNLFVKQKSWYLFVHFFLSHKHPEN